MKILFIHDHPFYKEDGLVYSGGGLPARVWLNYLVFFTTVQVFGRKSNDLKDKKILSSFDNVSFNLTQNYSTFKDIFLKKKIIKNELKNAILTSDIVIVRLPSVLGFLAAPIAQKMGKQLIVEQVGSAYEAMNTQGTFLGKVAAPFFQRINKKIVKNADYVSYVTISKLQKEYPATVLTASISDVVIESIVSEKELNTYRFTNKIFKIGLIGGFDARYKGQDVLLKAIHILPSDIKSGIELYFIGKGDSSWLLNLAKTLNLENNIKFIGSKESGKEIFEFLSTLSLYVQPSLTEGMPRALLEAMSVGCPVLGSKVGGIPDVIENEFLHNPGDFKTLSNQISKLFKNRKLLEREAFRSVEVVTPFQKDLLNHKRKEFYKVILNNLQNA